MALTTSYLTSTKNFEMIMNTIINARAPERFTVKFLEDLGFKSSSDRLIIGILKALGLIDENSAPTQRYFEFLDQSRSKHLIAQGVQEAYEDLFNLRKDAQNLTNEEVKNRLRTLTQGQKGDRVIELMAMTFRALCSFADWTETNKVERKIDNNAGSKVVTDEKKFETTIQKTEANSELHLCYNIQIHLPETRDMAVYDAIFQSLKKHLV